MLVNYSKRIAESNSIVAALTNTLNGIANNVFGAHPESAENEVKAREPNSHMELLDTVISEQQMEIEKLTKAINRFMALDNV